MLEQIMLVDPDIREIDIGELYLQFRKTVNNDKIIEKSILALDRRLVDTEADVINNRHLIDLITLNIQAMNSRIDVLDDDIDTEAAINRQQTIEDSNINSSIITLQNLVISLQQGMSGGEESNPQLVAMSLALENLQNTVATNTAKIVDNAEDIDTNEDDISDNKLQILTNSFSISTNSRDTDDLDAALEAVKLSVTTNVTAVTKNTEDITKNTTEISTLEVAAGVQEGEGVSKLTNDVGYIRIEDIPISWTDYTTRGLYVGTTKIDGGSRMEYSFDGQPAYRYVADVYDINSDRFYSDIGMSNELARRGV